MACVSCLRDLGSGYGKGFVGAVFPTCRPLSHQLSKPQIQLYNNIIRVNTMFKLHYTTLYSVTMSHVAFLNNYLQAIFYDIFHIKYYSFSIVQDLFLYNAIENL